MKTRPMPIVGALLVALAATACDRIRSPVQATPAADAASAPPAKTTTPP